MKPIFILFSLAGLFSGCTPARSETQLPINELFPCEVVLHELIADLRKLRVAAKHITVGLNDENQKNRQRPTIPLCRRMTRPLASLRENLNAAHDAPGTRRNGG